MGSRKAKTRWLTKSALNMSEEEVLLALETLAKTLDVQIRYEKGDFIGGLCRIGEHNAILLQKTDPPVKKIQLLAKALGSFNLDQIYILPALREIIDEEMQTVEGGISASLSLSDT